MHGITTLTSCSWLKKFYCKLMRNLRKYKGFANKSVPIAKTVKFRD